MAVASARMDIGGELVGSLARGAVGADGIAERNQRALAARLPNDADLLQLPQVPVVPFGGGNPATSSHCGMGAPHTAARGRRPAERATADVQSSCRARAQS